jgi:hypothetical protein
LTSHSLWIKLFIGFPTGELEGSWWL